MSVIVTDDGFKADDWDGVYLNWEGATLVNQAHEVGYGIELPNDADAEDLVPFFNEAAMIRITFPSSADGRGFSVARTLRLLGYRGRLRAQGDLISDQYAMARRSGFDEVEITDERAKRQPEAEWLFRANWKEHDYQSKLRASAS